MSKYLSLLAKNIQLYASGKSINEISKLSGVPQSTISRLISEQSNPSLDTIEKIADGIGVEPSTLLIDKISIKNKSYSIPSDIIEMLDGQSETVYDTIRTMLKALNKRDIKKSL